MSASSHPSGVTPIRPSYGPAPIPPGRGGLNRRANQIVACWDLTKPRVTLLVILTALAAYFAAGAQPHGAAYVVSLTIGIGVLAGGTAALNQVWEREADGLMRRAAIRPLPSGRMLTPPALMFGLLMVSAGLWLLFKETNHLTGWLGVATSLVYLLAYTPLKYRSPLSTVIGAFPGASPLLMGWAAARNHLDAGAWVLFGIQFLWQFPHFLAIARLYQEDYERAGIRMLPVVDPNGAETGRQMILYALALLPVSLIPTLVGIAGPVYAVGALLLGVGYLAYSVQAARRHDRGSALRLLKASVIYLPLVFILMIADHARPVYAKGQPLHQVIPLHRR